MKLVHRASKGVFQRATELWTFSPSEFYLLYPLTGNWELIPEIERCEEFQWCRDDNTRKAFFEELFKQKVPAGYKVPFGATAVFLSKFPDRIPADRLATFGLRNECGWRDHVAIILPKIREWDRAWYLSSECYR